MAKDRKGIAPRFWLGLGVGILGGIALGRKLAAPRRMPHLGRVQQVLSKSLGEGEAAAVAARVQTCYDQLYARRQHVKHPVLRTHLEQMILPSLALYQVLRAEGCGLEEAIGEVEGVLRVLTAPAIRGIETLGHLPGSFDTFRKITRWIIRLGFPPSGWSTEMVEDSDRVLAINYHRCFYLDVLTVHGAPELTPVFCATDDWVAEALPPEIQWERTQTMGRGGVCCDFRWSVGEVAKHQSLNQRFEQGGCGDAVWQHGIPGRGETAEQRRQRVSTSGQGRERLVLDGNQSRA